MKSLKEIVNLHSPNYFIGSVICLLLGVFGVLTRQETLHLLLGFNLGFFITLYFKEFAR